MQRRKNRLHEPSLDLMNPSRGRWYSTSATNWASRSPCPDLALSPPAVVRLGVQSDRRTYRTDRASRHSALRRAWRARLDAADACAGRQRRATGADGIAHRPRPLALCFRGAQAGQGRRTAGLRVGLAGRSDQSDPWHAGGDGAKALGRRSSRPEPYARRGLRPTRLAVPMPSSWSTARAG